jgi:hypothetical protein
MSGAKLQQAACIFWTSNGVYTLVANAAVAAHVAMPIVDIPGIKGGAARGGAGVAI